MVYLTICENSNNNNDKWIAGGGGYIYGTFMVTQHLATSTSSSNVILILIGCQHGIFML